MKKGILVVSFGTSFHRTREKTIDRIEADIEAAYPDYQIYRAWTSKMIIAKLLRRDGIRVMTVSEAVEQMIEDGIRELIVQPTHVTELPLWASYPSLILWKISLVASSSPDHPAHTISTGPSAVLCASCVPEANTIERESSIIRAADIKRLIEPPYNSTQSIVLPTL